MNSADDYLRKTDSAVVHLFSAAQTYLDTLKQGLSPVFMSGQLPGPEFDAKYAVWRIENADALEKAKDARAAFREERFALDTLCGAILQIAEKGLEIYSSIQTSRCHGKTASLSRWRNLLWAERCVMSRLD